MQERRLAESVGRSVESCDSAAGGPGGALQPTPPAKAKALGAPPRDHFPRSALPFGTLPASRTSTADRRALCPRFSAASTCIAPSMAGD